MLRKFLIAVFVAGLGWAAPAGAGLFSSTGIVIAILAGDLFVGEAEGHLDGSGTLAIHSQRDPGRSCTGQFTSSPGHGGSGRIQCTDGATGTFQFRRLSVRRGYGTGESSKGLLSFAYGLTHDEAGAYLRLPEGKRLVQSGARLALVDL